MTSTKHHTDHVLAKSADVLRRQIAVKRDMLIGRQRQRFAPGRQRLIDQLGDQYREVYQVTLDCEGG